MTDNALLRVDFGRVSVFPGQRSGKYPDGNQIIIRGSDVVAAFDTPLVANTIGLAFEATELVILSHAHEDHMAGLHLLPDAEIHVHNADLAAVRSWGGMLAALGSDTAYQGDLLDLFRRDFFYTPRPDAFGYADGARWELGHESVRAFHMPGHTAGHSALFVESESLLFISDIDLTGFGPYYGDAGSSLDDFRRTLQEIAKIDARVWVTAHHRGIYTDRELFLSHLAAYAAKIERREQRLLDLLAESPKTLAQLVECRLLYPAEFKALWVIDAETRTIAQHLSELLEQGRVAKFGCQYCRV